MSGSPSANFLPIASMMFAAGIGIPIFAAFNSGLSKQLGSPIAATAVTFAIGFVIALALVAIPVAFYVAISASALPALFPTATRFGAMGIAYNLAVSLFGGTAEYLALWARQAGRERWYFWYVAACVAGSFVVYVRLPETRDADLSRAESGAYH